MKTEVNDKAAHGEDTQSVEDLLSQASHTNTVDALMEVYESIERSYRDAVMAGEVQPSVASSTNYR